MIDPVAGPQLVVNRATFKIKDTTQCIGDDATLALYVVFSSPDRTNQTYVYSQRVLEWLRSDTFEVAIESTHWFVPGLHSVQIQIRDMYKNTIERMTSRKEISLDRTGRSH